MTKDEAIFTLAQCREVVADPQCGLTYEASRRLVEAIGRMIGWLEKQEQVEALKTDLESGRVVIDRPVFDHSRPEGLGVLGWLEAESESDPWRPCSREFAIENREHCEHRVRCNNQPDEWSDWESCSKSFNSDFSFTILDYQFRTNLPPAEVPEKSLCSTLENSDYPVDFCEY